MRTFRLSETVHGFLGTRRDPNSATSIANHIIVIYGISLNFILKSLNIRIVKIGVESPQVGGIVGVLSKLDGAGVKA